jgi:hypothetical protein
MQGTKLKDQDHLTLSLDGWTNNSGKSLYALMALKGVKKNYFINVLDLKSKRHTEENIFSKIKRSLKAKRLDFDQISAIVINSPSTMVKLWVSYCVNHYI